MRFVVFLCLFLCIVCGRRRLSRGLCSIGVVLCLLLLGCLFLRMILFLFLSLFCLGICRTLWLGLWLGLLRSLGICLPSIGFWVCGFSCVFLLFLYIFFGFFLVFFLVFGGFCGLEVGYIGFVPREVVFWGFFGGWWFIIYGML